VSVFDGNYLLTLQFQFAIFNLLILKSTLAPEIIINVVVKYFKHAFTAFIVLTVCLSVMYFVYDFIINK